MSNGPCRAGPRRAATGRRACGVLVPGSDPRHSPWAVGPAQEHGVPCVPRAAREQRTRRKLGFGVMGRGREEQRRLGEWEWEEVKVWSDEDIIYRLQWVMPNIHMVINFTGRLLDRAVPVPCHVPGWRPRHGLVPRAGPKRRAAGHRASACVAKYSPSWQAHYYYSVKAVSRGKSQSCDGRNY
jgi:hypothetical protein